MSSSSAFGRMVRPILLVLAALWLLVEELVWNVVAELVARLARLRLVARLEARIARLGPYPAMTLFILPVAAVLPFKLYGTWLIATGHVITGVGIIVIAKLGGTVFLTRLFEVCRPQLLRIGWFARFHDWLMRTKRRLHDYLHSLPAWVALTRRIHAVRRGLRNAIAMLRGRLAVWRRRGPSLVGRLRAARRFLARSGDRRASSSAD